MSWNTRNSAILALVCFTFSYSLTSLATAQNRKNNACAVETSSSFSGIRVCTPHRHVWMPGRSISDAGGVASAQAVVTARARWQGKTISAMRIYVDHDNISTQLPGGEGAFISHTVDLRPGQHRIVVVAWTSTGDVLISEERLVTVNVTGN